MRFFDIVRPGWGVVIPEAVQVAAQACADAARQARKIAYRSRDDGYKRVTKFLASRGFSKIGRGAFSEVWGKNDHPTVWKINFSADRWPDYIAWAMKEGFSGTYAPKVHALKRFKQDFYVAIVDRLRELKRYDEKDQRTGEAELVDDLASEIHTEVDIVKNTKEKRRWSSSPYLVSRRQSRQDDLERFNPGIGEFVKKFARDFGKVQLDLHRGNFMINPDGRVVLTDPITGDPTNETNKVRIKNGHAA